MCVNQFYPIQPGSFWSLQMLFISLPIMLYMVYVSHKQEKINISKKLKKAHLEEQKSKAKKEVEARRSKFKKIVKNCKVKKDAHGQLYATPDGRQYNSDDLIRILEQQEKLLAEQEAEIEANLEKMLKNEDETEDKATKSSGKDNSTPPKLFLGYALMVLVRTVIDALFIAYYFQVYSFTFVMPEQYQCDRAPCNNVVACYVDRPKQKTLVIYIMFATGCITVLVGLIEFFSLGMGKIYEAWANRHDDITKEYKVGKLVTEKDVAHIALPAYHSEDYYQPLHPP